MKQPFLKTSLLAPLLCLSFTLKSFKVQATPTKFHNCDIAKKIQLPTNSSGYLMDDNCMTVYVLPPEVGSIEVSAYAPNQTDEVCSVINSQFNSLNQSAKLLAEKEKLFLSQQEQLLRQNPQVENLRNSCEKLSQINSSTKTQLNGYDRKIEGAEEKLSELKTFKEKCKTTKEDDPEIYDCEEVDFKIEDTIDQLRDLKDRRENLSSKAIDISEKHQSCQQFLSNKEELIKSKNQTLVANLRQVRTEKGTNYNDLKHFLRESSEKSGATMALIFKTKQIDQVREFQRLNRTLSLNFMPMPIKTGILSVELVKNAATELMNGTSILLNSTVNGLTPRNSIDEGEANQSLMGVSDTNANIVFGQAAGGNITINQIAACIIQKSLSQGMSAANQAKAAAVLLAPTITYRFDAQVGRKVSYKYKEDHLYQLIKKHTETGGFFKTSAVNSIFEKAEASKWIQIEIKSEDSAAKFNNPEFIAENLKAMKMDEALLKVAQGYLSASQSDALPTAPKLNGAWKTSDTLKKCTYFFCQEGAVIVDIANSVFGGSTAESDMTRIVNASISYVLKIDEVVPNIGTMALSPQQ